MSPRLCLKSLSVPCCLVPPGIATCLVLPQKREAAYRGVPEPVPSGGQCGVHRGLRESRSLGSRTLPLRERHPASPLPPAHGPSVATAPRAAPLAAADREPFSPAWPSLNSFILRNSHHFIFQKRYFVFFLWVWIITATKKQLHGQGKRGWMDFF